MAPKPLPPPMIKWRMPLFVSTGAYYDCASYLSVREDASETWDVADVIEIDPLTSDYVRLYFNHMDWPSRPSLYTQDARPLPAEGESVSWTATVEATAAAGTVQISWEIPPAAAQWIFTLRDCVTGIVSDMRQASAYSYAASGADTRDFTITATRLGAFVLGDADMSGAATDADAVVAAKAEHGLAVLSAAQIARADMDASGAVDSLDALLILKSVRGYLAR